MVTPVLFKPALPKRAYALAILASRLSKPCVRILPPFHENVPRPYTTAKHVVTDALGIIVSAIYTVRFVFLLLDHKL